MGPKAQTLTLILTIAGGLAAPNSAVNATIYGGNPSYALGNQEISPLMGKDAPEFSLMDLDGIVHSSSDYLGRPLVLNFWEQWCGPCRAEMPGIQEFATHYEDSVAVLGVTGGVWNDYEIIDPEFKRARKYLAENNFTFTNLTDPEMGLFGDYGRIAWPTTVIIDKDGKIAEIVVGFTEFMEETEPVRMAVDKLLSSNP